MAFTFFLLLLLDNTQSGLTKDVSFLTTSWLLSRNYREIVVFLELVKTDEPLAAQAMRILQKSKYERASLSHLIGAVIRLGEASLLIS